MSERASDTSSGVIHKSETGEAGNGASVQQSSSLSVGVERRNLWREEMILNRGGRGNGCGLTEMTQSTTGFPRELSATFLRYVRNMAMTCSGE